MALLKVMGNDASDHDNFYLDTRNSIRAVMAALADNEPDISSWIVAFGLTDHAPLHVEESIPSDLETPQEAVTLHVRPGILPANRQVWAKFKDSGGTVREGFMGFLT